MLSIHCPVSKCSSFVKSRLLQCWLIESNIAIRCPSAKVSNDMTHGKLTPRESTITKTTRGQGRGIRHGTLEMRWLELHDELWVGPGFGFSIVFGVSQDWALARRGTKEQKELTQGEYLDLLFTRKSFMLTSQRLWFVSYKYYSSSRTATHCF